jgi:ribosomal protein L32
LLSKFRLSAHSLAIEKGRCSNIERQNRVSLSCDTGEVENEYNFFSTFQR